MRLGTIRTAGLCGLLILGAGATGCASKTEGDRTLEKSAAMSQAGNLMKRGEQMQQDGAALEAAGKVARDQGDTEGGTKKINDGQAEQKQGEALIEQGRKEKMDNQ